MEFEELILCTLFIPFGPSCAGLLLPPSQAHQLPISLSSPGGGAGLSFPACSLSSGLMPALQFVASSSLLSSVGSGKGGCPLLSGLSRDYVSPSEIYQFCVDEVRRRL